MVVTNDTVVDLPFPTRGLFVASSLAKQPPQTAPIALNVRGYDPKTQRLRGAQREGMTKYMPQTLDGKGSPIQELSLVTTTQAAPQLAVGVFAHPLNNATPNGIQIEAYLASGKFSLTSTVGASFGQAYGLVWDNNAILYVVFNAGGTSTTVVAYDCNATVSALLAGANTTTAPVLLWQTAVAETINTPVGIDVGGGFVWIGVQVGGSGGTSSDFYAFATSSGAMKGGTTIFTANKVQSTKACNWLSYCQGVLCVGYAGNFLDFHNTINGTVTRVSGGSEDNIEVFSDGQSHFFTIGRKVSDDSTASLHKFDLYAAQVTPVSLANHTPRTGTYDPVSTNVLVGYDTNDGSSHDYTLHNSTDLSVITTLESNLPNHFRGARADGAGGYFVSGQATAGGGMGYDRISSANPYTSIQHSYATSAIPLAPGYAAVFGGYVSPLPEVGSFFVRGIGVAGGTVARFTTAGPISIAGGTNALNPGASVIFSAQQGQQLYFADGVYYKYYDVATDSILAWTASSGTLPRDAYGNPARLICNWRNRIVLSGLRYDPFNYFMSALGDPTNWNYNPNVVIETQAIAGNLSTAGSNLDIITALIPYSDELLIFGGSRTIYQMTGDPASGGRVDQISNGIGMAWGNPWCRDGFGNIYFVSNRGTIYQYVPGAPPQRISDPIQQLLTTLNMDTTVFRMAWDERQLGFHVWCTLTGGPQATLHYFWDSRNYAWYQDQYASNVMNPFAVLTFESGDPNFRYVLIGGQDGYIRKLDTTANDDDGTGIQSQVYIPVQERRGFPFEMADLQCDLASTSSPVLWAAQGARDAQVALTAPESKASGTFAVAGRNRSQALRVFGHQGYVVLSGQNVAGSSWALESLAARMRVIDGLPRRRRF